MASPLPIELLLAEPPSPAICWIWRVSRRLTPSWISV